MLLTALLRNLQKVCVLLAMPIVRGSQAWRALCPRGNISCSWIGEFRTAVSPGQAVKKCGFPRGVFACTRLRCRKCIHSWLCRAAETQTRALIGTHISTNTQILGQELCGQHSSFSLFRLLTVEVHWWNFHRNSHTKLCMLSQPIVNALSSF